METVVEEVVKMPETVASYFEAVGETIGGMLTSAVNVFNSLWTSGIPGQVICTMGVGSILIGIGLSLFKIRNGRRKSR